MHSNQRLGDNGLKSIYLLSYIIPLSLINSLPSFTFILFHSIYLPSNQYTSAWILLDGSDLNQGKWLIKDKALSSFNSIFGDNG